MKTLQLTLAALGVVAALVTLAYLDGKRKGFEMARDTIERNTDTVWATDTVMERYPVPVFSHIVDTIYVPYVMKERDTIYLELPRTRRIYYTDTYTAYISGYKPSLDSIAVRQRTKTVYKTVTEPARPSVSIGIQGGYGITPKGFQPYVGIGVQYNICQFLTSQKMNY